MSSPQIMTFFEIKGSADPKQPLIYLWELLDQDGEVYCHYVGQASKGASRPHNDYRNNVNKLLQGGDYRPSKPKAFRAIHKSMAAAVRLGHTIQLSLICNVAAGEDINALERKYQQQYMQRYGPCEEAPSQSDELPTDQPRA